MAKVAFTTLGCKVNQAETESLAGLFKQGGYTIVDFADFADVYVINTCSVTHLGERKSRQIIRRAVRQNPDAVVVVTGCYAQVAPEQVTEIPGVSLVVGTRDRERIVALVEEVRRSRRPLTVVGDIMAARDFEDIPLYEATERTRAFLKIQEGCVSFCSYCIIPYARGPLRSRPPESVLKEARKLVAAGFPEIVLTGIHLGAYGQDLAEDINLAGIVARVLAEPGLQRLRLSSVEPTDITPGLIDLMAQNPRFCSHLHIPLQSGDDAILRAMNRHYTTDWYRELVTGICRAVPDVAITTDIIVGFPGEETAHFARVMAFVKSLPFARIHVFPYSPRQGTPAADFPHQVPPQAKAGRVQAMQALAREKEAAFAERFIGRILPVLFEQQEDGLWAGLTGNYLRVFAQSREDLAGKTRHVELLAVKPGGIYGRVLS